MTARDVRYGRRGGRWAETLDHEGVCATCRAATARYVARHLERDERWPICARCVDQARRYSAPIGTDPLHVVRCGACGHQWTVTELPARCPRCRRQIDEAA